MRDSTILHLSSEPQNEVVEWVGARVIIILIVDLDQVKELKDRVGIAILANHRKYRQHPKVKFQACETPDAPQIEHLVVACPTEIRKGLCHIWRYR